MVATVAKPCLKQSCPSHSKEGAQGGGRRAGRNWFEEGQAGSAQGESFESSS